MPGYHAGMSTHLDPQVIEQRVRALLDNRIAAVRKLGPAHQATLDKREELEAAEREEAAVYAEALRAGWSPDELKQVGFEQPGKRAPGRPRRARTSAQRSRTATPDAAAAATDNSHASET